MTFVLILLAMPLRGIAWIIGVIWANVMQGFNQGIYNFNEFDNDIGDEKLTQWLEYSHLCHKEQLQPTQNKLTTVNFK